MKRLIPSILQVAGIVAVAVGAGMVWAPLGVILGGIGLFAVGFAVER